MSDLQLCQQLEGAECVLNEVTESLLSASPERLHDGQMLLQNLVCTLSDVRRDSLLESPAVKTAFTRFRSKLARTQALSASALRNINGQCELSGLSLSGSGTPRISLNG